MFGKSSNVSTTLTLAASGVTDWLPLESFNASVQCSWPATDSPMGVLTIELSSDEGAVKTPTLISNTSFSPAPSQPSGTAGVQAFPIESAQPYVRVRYAKSSGGTGCTMAITVTVAASGVTGPGAAAANALGAAGVTSTTGTPGGAVVLAAGATLTGATLTGATVNELTPTKTAVLATLSGGGFADRMVLQAQALVPDLTSFAASKLGFGLNPTASLPSGVTDSGDEGGVFTYNVQGYTILRLTQSIVSNPKTKKWAVAMRGIFPTPTNNLGQFGLANANFSSYVAAYSVSASSGGDNTKLCLQSGSTTAVSSWVIAAGISEFLLTSDAVNIKLSVNGSVVATLAVPASTPTGACASYLCANNCNMKISEVFYGWVG